MSGRHIADSRSGRALILGVLNVTPDSFSDGGRFDTAEAAVERAKQLIAQGADIVDVGGESTRPGAEPVAREEELRRVLPVIRALVAEGISVSIDTVHAGTAQAAVAAGARFINDVSGGLHDPAMLAAAAWASAEYGAGFIIGHWRGIPDPDYGRSDYGDVVAEVRDALAALAADAIDAGVDPAHIVLDPGLGFDKTGAQSWQLLAHLDRLVALGFPVLVGASRKRMIAETLGGLSAEARGRDAARDDVHERDLATSVVSALAARAGAWGVRVHDVAGSAQALAVIDAWKAAGEPNGGAATGRDDGAANRDRIALTGLEVFAHHGVFDFERERGQRFVIDAEVAVDLRAAAAGDELKRTVHYGELAEAIVAAVERDPVDLIETVAERVAAVALGFAGVCEATITVHKPDAPIDASFADVAVTVVRGTARGRRLA
ncbi:MAG: dihydropteroate synthase [Leucobacter sp.]